MKPVSLARFCLTILQAGRTAVLPMPSLFISFMQNFTHPRKETERWNYTPEKRPTEKTAKNYPRKNPRFLLIPATREKINDPRPATIRLSHKSYDVYRLFDSLETVRLKDSGVHVYVGKVQPSIRSTIGKKKKSYNLWFILEGRGAKR